jgi:hypothetical protein
MKTRPMTAAMRRATNVKKLFFGILRLLLR